MPQNAEVFARSPSVFGENILRGKHVHFMGIGGVGVSALARIAQQSGAEVSGCDLKQGRHFDELTNSKTQTHLGHSPLHLEGVDILVHTGAVSPDEPELLAARSMGIEIYDRMPMLMRLSEGRKLVGIAGSHGKTTSSTMAAALMIEAGLDPVSAIGGASDILGTNARCGNGDWFVAEVDESDGHIKDMSCQIAIVTNVDREHFEHYADIDEIKNTFKSFLKNTPDDGGAIVCADSDTAISVVKDSGQKYVTYGFKEGATYCVTNVELSPAHSTFDIVTPTQTIHQLKVKMPGLHNVQNAAAIVALADRLDIPESILRTSLLKKLNIERRMESYNLPKGVRLISDYAHHPAKVGALIAAVRLSTPGRLIAVFQPHRYTRTRHLGAEFGPAFAAKLPRHLPQVNSRGVDKLFVLPIYAASEMPLPGITGELVAEAATNAGVGDVKYLDSLQAAKEELVNCIEPNDTIVLIGAGDIDSLAASVREAVVTKTS